MNRMDTLVSIIIPVYNGEKYLQEAIDSALTQTYTNIEIIVINDGSTDRTEQICRSYGSRIRYYRKENGGVASAVNLGISKMRGGYFSWLSHDDIYYPVKIEKQLEALRLYGDRTAIVHGNYDIFNETFGSVTHVHNELVYSRERMENSVFPLLVTAVHGCVPLVHKSHFTRVGLFDEALPLTQDYDFFFRAMRGQKTVFLSEPLVKVRLHAGAGRIVSKQFAQACATQYLDFSRLLSDKEICGMFSEPLVFYYRTAGMLAARGFLSESADILNRMRELPQKKTVDFDGILKQIAEYGFEYICIFGAGFQGKLLLFELRGRGVQVDFFADHDIQKEEQRIFGVTCISMERLCSVRNRTLVIVSPDDSDDIMSELKQSGFINRITKKQLESCFLETRPYNFGVMRNEMES